MDFIFAAQHATQDSVAGPHDPMSMALAVAISKDMGQLVCHGKMPSAVNE